MNPLHEFFHSPFNSNLEDWEKSLLSELKLTELGAKTQKETLHGYTFPILSVTRNSSHFVPTLLPWKKASTSYAILPTEKIQELLEEDLAGGVRNFFFFDEALSENNWKLIEKTLGNFDSPLELEVFLLGEKKFTSLNFKVISHLITAREIHHAGGNTLQELAFLGKKITEIQTEEEFSIGVYLGTHFFHNISKLRALRLMAKKILQERKLGVVPKIVALTSFETWGLYERYSNMLRNQTLLASAYIGGADHVQSCGYETLLELEAQNYQVDGPFFRSKRMARNSSHILSLESMLGVVEDAAHGSYHLENLTELLCEKSWALMQRLLVHEDITPEIQDVSSKKLKLIKTRKWVFSGTNDYPDRSERLGVELKPSSIFRPLRVFEELRLRMEKFSQEKVYLALFGDYALLNSRVTFIKNYFEILGLEVVDPGKSEKNYSQFKKDLENRREKIVVLCALDEDYPLLSESPLEVSTDLCFIAGKFEMKGFKNIFFGQNIYDVLKDVVEAFERGVV